MDNYVVILSVPATSYRMAKKEMDFRNPHGKILRIARVNGQKRVGVTLVKGVRNG